MPDSPELKDAQLQLKKALNDVTKARLVLNTIEEGYQEFIDRHTQAKGVFQQARSALQDATLAVADAQLADAIAIQQARAEARAATIEALKPKTESTNG